MTHIRRIFTPRNLERLAWALLIAFLGYRMWPQAAAAFGVASANERAPDFQLTTLEGEPISLGALRGKVVLVNFWATWCPPCRVEMPGFQKVYDEYRDRGFVIVGISTDALGTGPVREFLGERGITYPNAMARGGVTRDFGGVRTLPTSFLIDRQGRIRHQVQGIFASITLEQAVQRLLDEPAPAPTPAAGPAPAPATGGTP